MADHSFLKGDWVTWKTQDQAQKFADLYGLGPFEIGDVRGDTLGIVHYFGRSRAISHLRHETGMAADFFKLSLPPESDDEGVVCFADE